MAKGVQRNLRARRHVKVLPGKHLQVISHQVITGEQGKRYCKTLPALFERRDSEF